MSGAGERTPPPPASTTGAMSSLLGKVFEVGEATRVVDAAIQVYLACSFTSVRCRGYVGEYTAVAFERQLAIIFGCWDNVCASTRRWSLARERTSCPGSKYCLRINTSKKERKPKGVSGICGWATDRGWNGLGSGSKP